MTHEIFMPALSSTMTDGKIVSWEKSLGDKVSKGETVLVVESDKADMDVESFYDGYLAAILVEAGGQAPVGAAIALLAETEADIETVRQQATTQATVAAPEPAAAQPPAPVATPPAAAPVPVAATATTAPPPTDRNGSGRAIASPRARKLAKDLGVEIAALQGSGPYGRIVAADVEAAAGKTPAATPAPAMATAAPAASTPVAAAATAPAAAAPSAAGRVVPLTTLQTAVVRSMVASLQVPVFRVSYAIVTGELDKLYQQIKPKGVTMTALLAKAVAVTLQQHPLLNARYTEAGVEYPAGINVAVAVAMDDGGLITPVLQNADRADIYSLSRTWRDLVARARNKQLQPEEYSTGTFTVSNLGMFGVESFDAILPPGTGSILAIGGSQPKAVATADGAIAVRRQMTVNITCDHRVIYGAHAAAFLQDLAKLIETNAQSLTL